MIDSTLKKTAQNLRKNGLSYSEILVSVPVAKSTLSLWLREIGLSRRQKQKITEKRLQAALRGAQRRKEQRLTAIEEIKKTTRKDIKEISKKELWLLGVALYWAEGSKEKPNYPGSGICFANSDPFMIKLFLKWLADVAEVKKNEIFFEIFIHENSQNRIGGVIRFWSKITGFPKKDFIRIYYKKNKIKTNRKNIGSTYFGLLRINVKASSILQRKIAGWINAINEYYWGVV